MIICPHTQKPCTVSCIDWDDCPYRPEGRGVIAWAAVSLAVAVAVAVVLLTPGCMVAYVKIEGTDPALYGHHQDADQMTVNQDIRPKVAETLAEIAGAKVSGNQVKVASDNKAEVGK